MRVLFCHCAAQGVLPKARVEELAACLKRDGHEVCHVEDLCGAVAREVKLPAVDVVLACRARAVGALLAAAKVAPGAMLLDLRSLSVAEVLRSLAGGTAAESGDGPLPASIDWREDWIPWYPVIDRQRCTSCGQCAEFCLFGVYEKDADGGVRVVAPDQCKLNCPACARICPEVAIVFPRCPHEPIDGSEVTPDNVRHMQVDVDAALGRNPYAMLAERRRRQGFTLREDS